MSYLAITNLRKVLNVHLNKYHSLEERTKFVQKNLPKIEKVVDLCKKHKYYHSLEVICSLMGQYFESIKEWEKAIKFYLTSSSWFHKLKAKRIAKKYGINLKEGKKGNVQVTTLYGLHRWKSFYAS